MKALFTNNNNKKLSSWDVLFALRHADSLGFAADKYVS